MDLSIDLDHSQYYCFGIYLTISSSFTADGSSGFKAEAGRYHLYVSYACPWANRALIVRNLKGLQDAITVDVVDWLNTMEKGWSFNPDVSKCI